MQKVKIEKLVFGGQGLGRVNNKVILVWNALPGEEVSVRITDDHKTYFEGIAEKIITPSKARIAPKEDHFLSCSPWQIISWEDENSWKKKIAFEVFHRVGDFPQNIDIAYDERQYEYRNKMEYRFSKDGSGKIILAFFGRGTNEIVPIDVCLLAEAPINAAAKAVLDWLNDNSIPIEILRSLAVRVNEKGSALAALFVSEEFAFINAPMFGPGLKGLQVYLLKRRTPNFSEKQLLFSVGDTFLDTELNGLKLKSGVISFSQVNVPLFKMALKDIASFVDNGDKVIDYYSGSGPIGLSVAKKASEVVLVDNSEESAAIAAENIAMNKAENCRFELMPSEKMTDLIDRDKTIVFDPPRAGLHRAVIAKVLEEKPERLIYLSCNLSSLARDVEKLEPSYKIRFARLYNFFPRTPHIEGLFVLDRV